MARGHAGEARQPVPPTGVQYAISAGPYRAVAVSAGGGLRAVRYGSRDLLDGYAEDAVPDGARGQVLAPWPNRLRDGRWHDGERLHQLPVDDHALGNAVHGLVRWSPWTVVLHEAHHVRLATRLHARPGYPFVVDLEAEYSLSAEHGLLVRLTARNPGARPAPVALGMHPYLAVPDGQDLDACTVRVPARSVLVSDARRTPTGHRAVQGTAFDLRSGPVLGERRLDDTFHGLTAAADGRVQVLVTAPDGTATELWTDGSAPYLHLFTGDTLSPARRRRGIAVEPMTGPPNALASGDSLTVLPPGGAAELRWGVRDRTAGPGGRD